MFSYTFNEGDGLGALLLFVGFLLGFFIYSKYKVQVGGIVATPILALYVLREPISIAVFAIATAAALLAIELAVRRTLAYGRRLYYYSAFVSIPTTFFLARILGIAQPAFFSIIPTIIAYNIHREVESVHTFARSMFIWLCELFAIIAFGAALSLFMG